MSLEIALTVGKSADIEVDFDKQTYAMLFHDLLKHQALRLYAYKPEFLVHFIATLPETGKKELSNRILIAKTCKKLTIKASILYSNLEIIFTDKK